MADCECRFALRLFTARDRILRVFLGRLITIRKPIAQHFVLHLQGDGISFSSIIAHEIKDHYLLSSSLLRPGGETSDNNESPDY
jgi:hypothetical protein